MAPIVRKIIDKSNASLKPKPVETEGRPSIFYIQDSLFPLVSGSYEKTASRIAKVAKKDPDVMMVQERVPDTTKRHGTYPSEYLKILRGVGCPSCEIDGQGGRINPTAADEPLEGYPIKN